MCTDLSGPHKEDLFGFKYVLIKVETSTRFLIAEPLKTKQPKEVAKSFINRYVPILGIPSKILLDQGTEYKNMLFKSLCTALHIEHNFNPTDKHSANLAERVIRDLNSYFRLIGRHMFRSWSAFLPLFCLSYNSHLNDHLGMSAYRALTGRQMPIPIELITACTPPQP